MLFRLNARREDTNTILLWEAQETAIIVCDMWDDHWCKRAAQRCTELAPRVNDFIHVARALGALVVHAPSDTMAFYSGMAQRRRAADAPPVIPPISITMRWNDPAREPELPIDDSDGGCDDEPPSFHGSIVPWKRQHPAIVIAESDIISDSGEEIYNVLVGSRVKNVIMTGVHTNKCVLARSFGIRQMVMLGVNVVLVRDLTDSLYNPRMPPLVSHDRGTELVVRHIEKYWCPTIGSEDLTFSRAAR